MSTLAFMGIVFSIVFIVVATIRGYHIIFTAPLATLIVLLTSRASVVDGLLVGEQSYSFYLGQFLANYFFMFFLGALLGRLMDRSGAAESLARAVLRMIGSHRPYGVMLGILLIASLLTYGGVSIFVVLFTLVPLCRPIFQSLDIKWSLVTIPIMLGSSTFTMSMLPASPAIQNVIPSQVLGTPLTAGAGLGILTASLTLIYGMIYMHMQLKSSLKKGESFASDPGFKGGGQAAEEDSQSLPTLLQSVLPLILMIGCILIFSSVDQIIIAALALANLSCLALNYKRLWPQFKTIIQQVSTSSLVPLFVTGSSIAYGSVLTHMPVFQKIIEKIIGLPLSPATILALLAMVLTFVTASAAGSIGIIMNQFADIFLQAGLTPAFIHRFTAIASATTTSLPYGGVIMNFNQLTGLSLADTYHHTLIVVGGSHLLMTLLLLLLA